MKRLKIFVLEVFTSGSRTRFSGAASGNFYGLVTEVKAEVAREGCGTSELLQSVAG